MNNYIKNAILAEEKYLKESLLNHELNFQEILKDYNYYDIDSYFKDKMLYMLKNNNFLTYKEVSAKELEYLIPQILKEKMSALLKLKTNNLCLTHGFNDKTLNEKLLLEYPNIEFLNSPCNGGTIILGPEDSFIFINLNNININHFNKYMLEHLYNFLKEYFNNVSIEGNDILIDDKKVIGTVIDKYSQYKYFAFFASFTDRSELIEKLINKKGKIPGFINSNILNKETFEKEVLSWLV